MPTEAVIESGVVEDVPVKLKDYDFTDIFFNEDGQSFMRGLDGYSDPQSPLQPVPVECLPDLAILHELIIDEAKGRHEYDTFHVDYDDMRFRVAQIGTVGETWFTLRRFMKEVPRLKSLRGIPPRVVESIGRIAMANPTTGMPGKGLILLCGETGSGKTTLASSIIQEYLLHLGDIAVTVEDPIELNLHGPYGVGARGYCFQTQVKDGDFKGAMKATMRRTPRYILLGEVRGSDEASEALRASINGHVVITTTHAGSISEGLNSMVKFVAGREPIDLARNILADGIAAVIHMSLVKVPKAQGGGKMLKISSLFFGPQDSAMRAAIRKGTNEMLVTKIEEQANRIRLNKPPTSWV